MLKYLIMGYYWPIRAEQHLLADIKIGLKKVAITCTFLKEF